MPKRKAKKQPQKKAAAAPQVPFGPEDASELEKLPEGNAYESLDEADAPLRGEELLEDDELVGLLEQAPVEEPQPSPALVPPVPLVPPLDEMTLGFKGRCAMVSRIKCKREGDGFHCDCICEDGYSIQRLMALSVPSPLLA